MHPFSQAVDPCWEARSDWNIYKGIAAKFSELAVGYLGEETDVVTLPMQHDSPAEMAQPFDVKDWKRGECELIPGKVDWLDGPDGGDALPRPLATDPAQTEPPATQTPAA